MVQHQQMALNLHAMVMRMVMRMIMRMVSWQGYRDPPQVMAHLVCSTMCDTWCYRYSCNMIHLLLNLVSAADSTDAEVRRRGAAGGASANPLQRVSCRVDELCETRGQCCCQIWTAVDLTAIRAGDNVRISVCLRGGGALLLELKKQRLRPRLEVRAAPYLGIPLKRYIHHIVPSQL